MLTRAKWRSRCLPIEAVAWDDQKIAEKACAISNGVGRRGRLRRTRLRRRTRWPPTRSCSLGLSRTLRLAGDAAGAAAAAAARPAAGDVQLTVGRVTLVTVSREGPRSGHNHGETLKGLVAMQKLIARTFSAVVKGRSHEPTVLTLANGTTIPYPRGIRREVNATTVIAYGQQAVETFLPETDYWSHQRNLAQFRYLDMRENLLRGWRGKWVAVNPKGFYVVADTENEVRKFAETIFPYRVDEYHADCVGCEILRGVVMDSLCRDRGSPAEFELVPHLSSGLYGTAKDQFVIRAEHSFSGLDFKTYIMKHSSGASMMGVPKEILSNPPPGVSLHRGENSCCIGPDGSRNIARVYNDNYIKVAGLSIKVDVIESRVWLLGFPVLSRFRNVLDITAKEVVVLHALDTPSSDHSI